MARDKQSDAETASVADVGTGSDARRIIRVSGWELTAWTGAGDEEPMVRDLDLAARLGFERPRTIRELIDRHILAGNINDSEVRRTVRQTSPQGGRPGAEFWLTEAGALFIASKSETPTAVALTKELIRVFMLARRGLLPSQLPTLTEDDVRRVAVSVLGEVLVPIVRELAELKRALAERPDGIISAYQAEELRRQLGLVARDLIDLGDYETMKAAKAALDQQIRAASGWGGTGRARWMMPASRYAEALAALRALQHQAERRIRRARRPRLQAERGQIPLDLN